MILAIDVGGTKLAAGLVSRDGTVTGSRRVATPQGADAETLWRTLIALVEPLAGHAEAVGGGLRRSDELAGRRGLAAQHPRLAALPAARPSRGAVPLFTGTPAQ
ncbi:hypothetical protein GCM10020001_033020 [Nonomuraea salmonea]